MLFRSFDVENRGQGKIGSKQRTYGAKIVLQGVQKNGRLRVLSHLRIGDGAIDGVRCRLPSMRGLTPSAGERVITIGGGEG